MKKFLEATEEREYRRILLRLAATGNVEATEKLAKEYHARIYSGFELSSFTPQVKPARLSAGVQRRLDALLYRMTDRE